MEPQWLQGAQAQAFPVDHDPWNMPDATPPMGAPQPQHGEAGAPDVNREPFWPSLMLQGGVRLIPVPHDPFEHAESDPLVSAPGYAAGQHMRIPAAETALTSAFKPILDAGNYVGDVARGLYHGNSDFHSSDAVQHAGDLAGSLLGGPDLEAAKLVAPFAAMAPVFGKMRGPSKYYIESGAEDVLSGLSAKIAAGDTAARKVIADPPAPVDFKPSDAASDQRLTTAQRAASAARERLEAMQGPSAEERRAALGEEADRLTGYAPDEAPKPSNPRQRVDDRFDPRDAQLSDDQMRMVVAIRNDPRLQLQPGRIRRDRGSIAPILQEYGIDQSRLNEILRGYWNGGSSGIARPLTLPKHLLNATPESLESLLSGMKDAAE